jgi:hypothetical protein
VTAIADHAGFLQTKLLGDHQLTDERQLRGYYKPLVLAAARADPAGAQGALNLLLQVFLVLAVACIRWNESDGHEYARSKSKV